MNAANQEMTIELVEPEPAAHPAPALQGARDLAAMPPPAGSPMGSALAFLQAGGNLDQLDRMMDLQDRWEANEARKAFVSDMAAFKKNPPEILKDKHVSFTTQKGTTAYDHATIGNVCDQIIKAAADHGFSHRWVPSRGEHGELIITCEVTHRLGHVELTTLEGPRDDSGTKNVLQANQSTRTYLQRHSLLMAFGFATKDQPDDDGAGAEADGSYDAEGTLREWTDKANAAINLIALSETRKMANAEFQVAKDLAGWEAFKLVANAKREQLVKDGAK